MVRADKNTRQSCCLLIYIYKLPNSVKHQILCTNNICVVKSWQKHIKRQSEMSATVQSHTYCIDTSKHSTDII